MLTTRTSNERIKLAARLYYVDGLSQAEVARILEISQAMVSRFLQAARDKGIVRITVEEYDPRDTALEQDLRGAFPQLRTVLVLREPAEASLGAIRTNLGYFGASAVADLFRSGQVVGLTGGRTLAQLIARLKAPAPLRDLRVVQLMGSIGAVVNDADASELGRVLATTFNGTCYGLNSPAFVSSPVGRQALLDQPQVQAVWDLFSSLHLALVGIGTLDESAFIDRAILQPADLRKLRSAGAVGEVCGRYFDANGAECATPFVQRTVSIELEQLRRVPDVVGVTVGPARGVAAAVAVRTGLIKSLVVDQQCARSILQAAGSAA